MTSDPIKLAASMTSKAKTGMRWNNTTPSPIPNKTWEAKITFSRHVAAGSSASCSPRLNRSVNAGQLIPLSNASVDCTASSAGMLW
ncbi:Uncharacterised protein [Klebsiella pneumoniae]|nr:Uncharacterised protein [Klebsiella pneumoniae]